MEKTLNRLSRTLRAGLVLALAFTLIGGGVSTASADDGVQDTTPPLITIRGVTPGGVYADGQVVVLEFECADPESGIAVCSELRGAVSGEPVTLEWTEENQGRVSWLVTAVNGAGLESSDYVLVSITREVNTSTSVSVDAPESHGWYNRPVTATVTGSDDSGKAISYVAYDQGFGWMEEYASTAAVEYVTEGTHTLLHYAMNADGGRSGTRETVIRIDFTAPTITPTVPELFGDDVPRFSRGQVVPFSFTCEDALSGVAACSGELVSGDALPTDEVGAHSYDVTAADFAGNSVTRTVRYTVGGSSSSDTTAPRIEFNSPDVNLTYETGKTFRLLFECVDDESEVTRCETESGLRSGELVTMNYTDENMGYFSWTVVAENAAGLTSSRILILNAIPAGLRQPATDLVTDVPGRNGWHRAPVAATVSATTTRPYPIREVWFNSGSGWVSTPGSAAPLLFEDEGVTVVEHYAVDEDSSASVVRESAVRIDLTAPSIASQTPELFADALRDDDGDRVPTFGFGEFVPFGFTCFDELSGMERCAGDLVAGDPLPTQRAGEHRYTLTATDLAGNETTRTVLYNVLGANETLAMTGVSSQTLPLGILATLLILGGAAGMLVFRTARR